MVNFLSVTLLLLATNPLQAADRCPRFSSSGRFSSPVPVECVDKGTIGFLAPSPMDLYPRVIHRGSPSFVSVTATENWKKSIYADSSSARLDRLNKLSRGSKTLRDTSLAALLNTASPKAASSAEELDQIVQSRCLLFASSSICKSAFDDDELISCNGTAASLAAAASDQSGNPAKIKEILSVVKEIGISHFSYVALFAALKYLAPGIVEPVSTLINSKFYFEEARNKARDTHDVLRTEQTNWFQAFLKAQKNRDLEAYCYAGSSQFRHRLTESLGFLQSVYEELPEE